jgi:small subunit ribosomal protein S29
MRTGKRMQLSKFKKNRDTGKIRAPLPGERKAYRKRIVLSNDNALPVPDLAFMNTQNLLEQGSAGKVLGIPGVVVDQLRAIEAFKTTQTWGIFRSPSTLIRNESVDLFNRMQSNAGRRETLRLVITGDKISGKSTVLLQAMANAYLNGWIVFNIPEGIMQR